MDLLLDTHVMLGLADPESYPLPQRLVDALDDTRLGLFVSAASLWEMAIKHRLGKLPLLVPLVEWPELLITTGFDLIDISVPQILADLDPVPGTKDPFDRLLLATAAVEQLQLVTIDRKLADHPLVWRP